MVALPAMSILYCSRRTEILAFARPRSIAARPAFVAMIRSSVAGATSKNAAISSSVHWMDASFSSSASSTLTLGLPRGRLPGVGSFSVSPQAEMM